MRSALLLLLTCAACGSVAEPPDGSGGALEGTGGAVFTGTGGTGTGGEASSGGASGGAAPGSGGVIEQTGGSSSGGTTSSGGASSGGADGTGGGSGGTEPECSGPVPTCVVDADPCEPPTLSGAGAGDDLNAVCGWASGAAPTGYASSYESECPDDIELLTRRMAWPAEGVDWETYVSVIDPGDRCEGAASGLDRSFSIEGAPYCMRVSSPFEGETYVDPNGPAAKGFSGWGSGSNEPGFCVVLGFEGAEDGVPEGATLVVDVGLDVPGWVQVDAAELVDWDCPLSCD